jgi:cytosine permease
MLVPPLVGPLLMDYYVLNKDRYAQPGAVTKRWNIAAIGAYAIGAASTFFAPEWVVNSLLGLIVSMIAYLILSPLFNKS